MVRWFSAARPFRSRSRKERRHGRALDPTPSLWRVRAATRVSTQPQRSTPAPDRTRRVVQSPRRARRRTARTKHRAVRHRRSVGRVARPPLAPSRVVSRPSTAPRRPAATTAAERRDQPAHRSTTALRLPRTPTPLRASPARSVARAAPPPRLCRRQHGTREGPRRRHGLRGTQRSAPAPGPRRVRDRAGIPASERSSRPSAGWGEPGELATVRVGRPPGRPGDRR
jgi:hypothetical protein